MADLICLAGTFPQDTSGAIVGRGDVAAQTREVIERLREGLAGAGTSLDRAVSVTVYLRSAADFQAMNDAYRTFWPKDPPARTTVVTDLLLPDALVEMSMVAVPPGAQRHVVHPRGWMTSPNPYSYAIRTGDTVFLSGLVSRSGRDNSAITGDITTETRIIMDNAGELLEAAGMSHADIVSARVYLPETESFQAMNAAYRPYFPGAPPARATVQAALAGRQYGVEITLIASSAPREAVNGGTPNPNLSGAIRAGDRLYLSGILGNTPENAGDAAAQTRETLARVRHTLDAAGFTAADIVEALVYLTDLRDYDAMDAVYASVFGGLSHPRTTVRSGLVAPGGVVEIMCTAARQS